MGKRKAAEVVEEEQVEAPAVVAEVEADADAPSADGKSAAQIYADKIKNVSAIASPLASRKLTKKVLKAVKKAAKSKHLKRGVKEVVKAVRKGEKGLVVIAGDISPIDVITHIPVLCEDADVSYLYVPSKEDLGLAGATKRPTSCIMIAPKDNAEQKAAVEEIKSEIVGASA